MKKPINGKMYDSDKCERIADLDHYNNGNYVGTSYIIVASDGTILLHCDSTGRDVFVSDELRLWGEYEDSIDDYTIINETRAVELGLLTR